MAISDIKQKLSQIGGKTPSSTKEEKKDISMFGGKSFIKKQEGRRWAKRTQSLFRTTGLRETERDKLWQRLFEKGKEYIQKEDPKRVLRELEKGKWGKFKDLSLVERRRSKIMIEKFLGK